MDELTYALGTTQEAKAYRIRGSMGSGITLNHIEAGKEERMMSGSTCEG